mmetsp:Transcript_64104/g.209175  ORF Transcript_64104/g.209175 Transcript_64104/m.209175 type:complete len:220 (-) Transcript_64104:87-746(-)
MALQKTRRPKKITHDCACSIHEGLASLGCKGKSVSLAISRSKQNERLLFGGNAKGRHMARVESSIATTQDAAAQTAQKRCEAERDDDHTDGNESALVPWQAIQERLDLLFTALPCLLICQARLLGLPASIVQASGPTADIQVVSDDRDLQPPPLRGHMLLQLLWLLQLLLVLWHLLLLLLLLLRHARGQEGMGNNCRCQEQDRAEQLHQGQAHRSLPKL